MYTQAVSRCFVLCLVYAHSGRVCNRQAKYRDGTLYSGCQDSCDWASH
jgi:hypothetical protein